MIEFKNKSTTQTAKNIICDALQPIDYKITTRLRHEKKWRKHYPFYFKKIVQHNISTQETAYSIAERALESAYKNFVYYNHQQQAYSLDQISKIPFDSIQTQTIIGNSQQPPTWFVPYKGKNLTGKELTQQIKKWLEQKIIEPSHADALYQLQQHPEWFDLSDCTTLLLGAGSEAGPFEWLARWKANVIALDLPQSTKKLSQIIKQGNGSLLLPKLAKYNNCGVNLLEDLPAIIHWLNHFDQKFDIAALAYADGEKHVRITMAMDLIIKNIQCQSLMYMCTPTDVYPIPTTSAFGKSYLADNQTRYKVLDCLVLQQGPNYALAKRLQQWRAMITPNAYVHVAPSTTTKSVTKNKLLKAAFDGAHLFGIEPFEPKTTQSIMAALWVYALRNPTHTHPLEITQRANHGGLWTTRYPLRAMLPLAALYGFIRSK